MKGCPESYSYFPPEECKDKTGSKSNPDKEAMLQRTKPGILAYFSLCNLISLVRDCRCKGNEGDCLCSTHSVHIPYFFT